jgi:predicted RNA binding protein YcfA (HicA-like mRNA interferase family)
MFTYDNAKAVIDALKEKGFEKEVEKTILFQTVCEVTNTLHPLNVKMFISSLEMLGFVKKKNASVYIILK